MSSNINPIPSALPSEAQSIDAEIERLRVLLADIAWLEKSFGRARAVPRVRDLGKTKVKTVEPLVYVNDKEYYQAYPNDVLKSFSFFTVNDPRQPADYKSFSTPKIFTAPVSLIVWGNLEKVDSTKDYIFTEELINDVIRRLNVHSTLTVSKVVEQDINKIYQGFTIENERLGLLMYPYFAFRIDMVISYKVFCDTPFMPPLYLPPAVGSYVVSFNARPGVVVPQAGDYTAEMITGLQDLLDEKLNIADLPPPVDLTAIEAELDAIQSELPNKLNVADYNDRYKGKYTSLPLLTAAHPAATSGDYAVIDAGIGTPARQALWDSDSVAWVIGSDITPATTDQIPEGATNLYHTTDRVRATILTGLSLISVLAVTAADTFLVAIGKLQAQITALGLSMTAEENESIITNYGDGSDGDAVITEITSIGAWLVGGILTRDAYLNNLTISGTGTINTASFKLFIKGTLNLSNAPANAIQRNGNNGGNGATIGTGGATGTVQTAGTVGANLAGVVGGAGGINAGAQAVGSTNPVISAGGRGGTGNRGGAGSGGAGGIARTANAVVSPTSMRRLAVELLRGAALITGGGAGGGGGGAGGNAAAAGGGGGGTGLGGGIVALYAKNIIVSAATSISAISARGGNGGLGAQTLTPNCGGGGGAGGGGGGWVYMVYDTITNPTAVDFINTSGGSGGDGGIALGTGIGGTGGTGGAGGRITVVKRTTGTVMEVEGITTIGAATVIATTTVGTSGSAGTLMTAGALLT